MKNKLDSLFFIRLFVPRTSQISSYPTRETAFAAFTCGSSNVNVLGMEVIMKRIKSFIVLLTVLCSVFMPALPIQAEIDQSKWITSGIYQYEVLDKDMKTVTLWEINSSEPDIEIPKIIDGYNVISVGGNNDWDHHNVMGKNLLNLKSLTVPATVRNIGANAFEGCKNLEKVKFFKDGNLIIRGGAFEDCSKLVNVTLYSARLAGGCFHSPKKRIELTNVVDESYWRLGSGYANFQTPDILVLNGNGTYDTSDFVGKQYIKEVYLNDETRFTFGNYITVKKLFVNGKLSSLGGEIRANNIYTIPSAKVIKAAQKAHVTYHVKSTGSMKKVTRKAKGKKYRYSWKPVKTTIKTYKYKGKKKGWKCTKKKAATQYYVYAKKSRLDDYQLIKTTKKKQITTSYKYVKVKPVKIWLE